MSRKLDMIEMCKELGLSESTVMDYILRKNLPAYRNNEGAWECDETELKKWRFPDYKPKTVFTRKPPEEAAEAMEKPEKTKRPYKKSK